MKFTTVQTPALKDDFVFSTGGGESKEPTREAMRVREDGCFLLFGNILFLKDIDLAKQFREAVAAISDKGIFGSAVETPADPNAVPDLNEPRAPIPSDGIHFNVDNHEVFRLQNDGRVFVNGNPLTRETKNDFITAINSWSKSVLKGK